MTRDKFWLTSQVRQADLIAMAAMEVMPFLTSGKLQIIAGQTFPLTGTTQAHQAIAECKSIGKGVLLV